MAKQKNKPPVEVISPSNSANSAVFNAKWWLAGAAIFLFVIARIAYSGAHDHQFLSWDDQLYVTENPMVLKAGKPGTPPVWRTPIALNYHPLTMETLVWNAKNAEVKNGLPDPAGFINTNITIHTLNGVLVLLLVWLITQGNFFVSLFTALIFALHPMHVESVAWISERKDVLYTFFFLLSAMAYWHSLDQRKWLWLMASFGLFILACLSKAMAVSLVPVLFLLDWWRGRSLTSAGVWAEKLPFIAAALFFGLVAVDIQAGGNFHGMLSGIEGVKTATAGNSKLALLDRLLLASYGMVQYIGRFFGPFNLSPFYPYPEAFINRTPLPSVYPFSLVVFVLLSGLTWFSLKRTKIVAFGLGFYFFTVALVSQFFAVGLVVMADRYTYLPYVGLAFAVLMGIWHFAQKSKTAQTAAYVVAGAFAVFLLVRTQQQVEVWQNTETLWTAARAQFPREGQILANLGNYYGKMGQLDKAAECFEQALQQNIRNASVYEGLGNVYGFRGDPKKAADMFSQAIGIDPNRGILYYNRGTAALSFDLNQSVSDFTKALELMPPAQKSDLHSKRALAYIRLQQYQNALNDYNAAIQIGPPRASDYHDRGVAKLNLNDRAGAIADIQKALQLDPNFEQAKQSLRVLMGQ
jgi:protein O-mannosyl-transferase